MSSWQLPGIHMTLIRNGLIAHLNCPLEEANKLVKSMAKMNAYATGGRYGERLISVSLGTVKDIPNERCFLNLMECLRYQCSEGNTEAKHAKTWKTLESIIGKVALSVLHRLERNMTETSDSPPWGIFVKADIAKNSMWFNQPKP